MDRVHSADTHNPTVADLRGSKHMVIRDGGPRNSASYSVIDDEWPEVKALLERRRRAHRA
jgi:hypothetical protein